MGRVVKKMSSLFGQGYVRVVQYRAVVELTAREQSHSPTGGRLAFEAFTYQVAEVFDCTRMGVVVSHKVFHTQFIVPVFVAQIFGNSRLKVVLEHVKVFARVKVQLAARAQHESKGFDIDLIISAGEQMAFLQAFGCAKAAARHQKPARCVNISQSPRAFFDIGFEELDRKFGSVVSLDAFLIFFLHKTARASAKKSPRKGVLQVGFQGGITHEMARFEHCCHGIGVVLCCSDAIGQGARAVSHVKSQIPQGVENRARYGVAFTDFFFKEK